jgi:hypothetical protein
MQDINTNERIRGMDAKRLVQDVLLSELAFMHAFAFQIKKISENDAVLAWDCSGGIKGAGWPATCIH